MSNYSAIPSRLIGKLRRLSLKAKVLLIAAAGLAFASGAVIVSEQPGFCSSCHIMSTYYESWKTSSHSEVNCLDCHLQPGFMGHVQGKINGLAQAVDCIVGRIGTKPNATITDASCLRPECHDADALLSKAVDYGGIKFAHKNHADKVVGGITITCGTCHSHFEGDEHFSVNSSVCFSCHFLVSGPGGNRLVETDCLDCHEPPSKVIRRGLVTVNHAEFASYQASCEGSCHKGQVEKKSDVADSACLNCHSFSKGEQYNAVELHEVHTRGEKVECFACHGKVRHGPTEDSHLTEMMDCKSCHSDTHNVQLTTYTANGQAQQSDRVLSPMFLTHVECTGCHIESEPARLGSVESIGKVAKAVPKACDNCHEPGTGQRYVPFWQGEIRGLHRQISERINELQNVASAIADEERAKRLKENILRAKTLVDSVEADGSWGVHNLKYTEAILLEARRLVDDTRQEGP